MGNPSSIVVSWPQLHLGLGIPRVALHQLNASTTSKTIAGEVLLELACVGWIHLHLIYITGFYELQLILQQNLY